MSRKGDADVFCVKVRVVARSFDPDMLLQGIGGYAVDGSNALRVLGKKCVSSEQELDGSRMLRWARTVRALRHEFPQ